MRKDYSELVLLVPLFPIFLLGMLPMLLFPLLGFAGLAVIGVLVIACGFGRIHASNGGIQRGRDRAGLLS